nr:unnamed protein product [Digitaria exilis]
MVVIELEPEPEPEPEQVKHPSPPAPEEAAAPETSWEEEARPSSPPAPEEQSAAGAGREALRVEEEEDAFEDALTDEQLREGKHDETIKECTKALELNPSYLKALIRRAEAHEKLEHYEEAIADLKKVIELDPSNQQAKRSLFRLEPLAAEKREKMKEEMIGKLKDLGNSVLGRFGMSVDNFKAVKDPNTGSYSIQFQK